LRSAVHPSATKTPNATLVKIRKRFAVRSTLIPGISRITIAGRSMPSIKCPFQSG
jgi:hypothetical protein